MPAFTSSLRCFPSFSFFFQRMRAKPESSIRHRSTSSPNFQAHGSHAVQVAVPQEKMQGRRDGERRVCVGSVGGVVVERKVEAERHRELPTRPLSLLLFCELGADTDPSFALVVQKSTSTSSMEPPPTTSRPSSSSSSHASARGSHNTQRVHFADNYIDLTAPSPAPNQAPPPQQHQQNPSNVHPAFASSNIPPELLALAFPDAHTRINPGLQNAALQQRRSMDQLPSSWQPSAPGAFSTPSPSLSASSRGGGDLLSWMRDLASPAASTPSSVSSGSASTPGSVSSSSALPSGTPAPLYNTTNNGPQSTIDLLTALINSGQLPQFLNTSNTPLTTPTQASASSLGNTSTPNHNPFPPRQQPLRDPSPHQQSFQPQPQPQQQQQQHAHAPPVDTDTLLAIFASLQQNAAPPPVPPLSDPHLQHQNQFPPLNSFPLPFQPQPPPNNTNSTFAYTVPPLPVRPASSNSNPHSQRPTSAHSSSTRPRTGSSASSSAMGNGMGTDPEVQAELARLRNRVAELEL